MKGAKNYITSDCVKSYLVIDKSLNELEILFEFFIFEPSFWR